MSIIRKSSILLFSIDLFNTSVLGVSMLSKLDVYICVDIGSRVSVFGKELGLVTGRHRRFPYLRQTYDGLKNDHLKIYALAILVTIRYRDFL